MIAIYRKIEANNALFGVMCVLLATLGLSLKAILIKLVYDAEPTIDAVSILTLRFLLAVPFFILLLGFTGRAVQAERITLAQVKVLALLGVVGFYLPAILDFTALAYIPAGLERLILFLYPTFVVIFSLFVRPGEITLSKIAALFVSYVGIVVVFIGQAPHLDSDMVLGAAMVFAAAVVFAGYSVLSVKQIQRHGAIRFTGYAMVTATLTSVVHGFATDGVGIFAHGEKVYVLVFIMAIFSTVLPLLLMAEGVKRIGASSTSIISTSGPPVTLVMAFFVLGESLGLLQAIGSVFILVGVYLVSRPQPAPEVRA